MIDFSGLADNRGERSVVNGVLFQVKRNGSSTKESSLWMPDPGQGKHFATELVTFVSPNGIALIVSLPNLETQFGYGYALAAEISVRAATTIDLFAGSTPVASCYFAGILDPNLTGGFAGVGSDTPFDRAVLTFSNVGDPFAVDNVTFSANRASDQGQTMILLSAGISVLLFLRARRGESRSFYH